MFFVCLFFFFFNYNLVNAENILLEEDFEDGNAQDGNPAFWLEENVTKNGFWEITDGGYYKGEVNTLSKLPIFSSAGDTDWKDYIFEVDITGIAGVDRQIYFRRDPSRPDGKKAISVKYVENNLGFDGFIELQQNGKIVQRNPLFKSKIGETHRVKVVALGRLIEVYVDGVKYLEYLDETEDPHIKGQIGFLTQKGAYKNVTLYDNVRVTEIPQRGPLELPFRYAGRGENDADKFNRAFWRQLTAVFDHNPEAGDFTNFLGEEYNFSDCWRPNLNNHNRDCYDYHNGYDFFSRRLNKTRNLGQPVLAAMEGEIVYANQERCKKDLLEGYGCSVIVKHNIENSDYYTLYTHLGRVKVKKGDLVGQDDVIGRMGNTGFSTGVHLHFSFLKGSVENNLGLNKFSTMKDSDWEKLILHNLGLESFETDSTGPMSLEKDSSRIGVGNQRSRVIFGFGMRESFCSYSVAGKTFYYLGPSGWEGSGDDPWSQKCQTVNKNYWKHELTSPQ